MFKIEEIREVFQLFKESAAQEFLFEQDSMKIAIRKNSNATPTMDFEMVAGFNAATETVVAVPERKNSTNVAVKNDSGIDIEAVQEIKSPMVGTFYKRENPEADPYVKIGGKVQPGDVVCIVEAMKLFNEIEAEVHGEIIDILVDDGEVVEYGQTLFIVKQEC